MLVHRSTFIHAIGKELPPSPLCTFHPCKRLTSLTQSDDDGVVTLYFADDSTATADVVIGADGVRSAVRANMLSKEEQVEPTWSGVIAYRASITREQLKVNGVGDYPIQAEPHMVRYSRKVFIYLVLSLAVLNLIRSILVKAGTS